MPVEIYPSAAKIKRNGVYQNLPAFVAETDDNAAQQMIATAEASNVAQYRHEVGDYFRLNDVLYETTNTINIGDSIVVGTNCKVAVLANNISIVEKDNSELKAAFDDLYTESENLYNPATDRHNKNIAGGVVVDNDSTKLSDYIYIGANNSFTVQSPNGYTGALRIFFYSAAEESFLTGSLYITSTPTQTFRMAATDNYIVILMYEQSGVYMVNMGESLLPYSPYGQVVAGETFNKLLEPLDNRLQFTVNKKNLIGMNSDEYYPVYIPAGSTITMSTKDGSNVTKNTLYILFFDKDKVFKGDLNFWSGNASRTVGLSAAWGDIYYVMWRTRPYIPVQLEIGSSKTAFEEYINNNTFETSVYAAIDKKWNTYIKSIAHRGSEIAAPENTMAAFKVAFEEGYYAIETDVRATSDDELVLIHDATVDRTTNGTGNVADLTYAQLSELDAGSWFSTIFEGEKVPKLSEFLAFCRKTGIMPVLEIKVPSLIEDIVTMAKSYGFIGNKITYLVDGLNTGNAVTAKDDEANIFLSVDSETDAVTTAVALRTGKNKVSLLAKTTAISSQLISDCIAENMELGGWTLLATDDILALDNYVTIILSGGAMPAKVIFNNVT